MIRVLTVVSLPPSALDIAPVREFHRSLRDAARHEAGAACATLAARGLVEDRVVEGGPREMIVREHKSPDRWQTASWTPMSWTVPLG